MSGSRVRSAHDEDGFALMAVLGVIALTSIMIAALFGLLLTTIRVTEQQERTAREARAADGAVTAAINHIRLNQVPGASDACRPAVPTTGFVVPFDRIDGPGDVSVTCAPAADSLGPSGGDLSLVGTGYAGGITNWKTAWPWASIGAGGTVSPSTVSPTLIHSGGGDLKFNGNVNSTKGAAVIRNPTAGSPALSVRGAYRQPLFGLGSSSDCGLLDDPGPTEIRTVGDRFCNPSVVVPGREPISNLVTPPALATMPGSCSGAVVTFAPGYYDQGSVKTLNSWFRGDAGCTGKTFFFPPGSYWFDANDSAVSAADRHALTLNNPSSNFVFGDPKGWTPSSGASATNFPSACSSRTGVANASPTIVLSGRTAFRHLAGRLAVCPDIAADGTLTPAMAQQSTAPNTVTVTSVANVAPPGSGWTNPDNMRLGRATLPAGPAVFPCSLPAGGFTLVTCISRNSFAMTLLSQAVGPIGSAFLTVTGDEYLPSAPDLETVNGVDRRTASIRVTHATGSCDTAVSDGSADRARTMTYELVSGTCRSGGAGSVPITDGAQLNGATVQITYSFRYVGICFFGPCPVPPQAMSIWDVRVRAGTRPMTTSSAAPPIGWDATPCGQPFCGPESVQSVTRTFSLPGVSLASASRPLQPSDPVQSAGVVIRQTGDAMRLFSSLPGELRMTLTAVDGTVCTTSTGSGVPNMAGATYYAMVGDGLSACTGGASAPDARGASWLEGATVSATMRLDCINPYGSSCGDPNDGSRLLSYVQPVRIDAVSVVATTDAYNGPVTTARLTVDSAGTSTAASANFFGPAIMPSTALDVYWNGTASGASLFGGSVQLFSLGSEMRAGATTDVVCCTRPETDMRKVRVTASIGGTSKLSVAVAIPTDPSREVEVLDWTVCGRNGSCA